MSGVGVLNVNGSNLGRNHFARNAVVKESQQAQNDASQDCHS